MTTTRPRPALAALCLALTASAAAADVPTARELGYQDFPGILHCHSLLSHDSQGTIEEITAAAKAAGVRFIMMTDHPWKGGFERAVRGTRDGVLFFPGQETRNLLLVDMTENLASPGKDGAIRDVARQGGLVFVAHPEEFTEWDLPFHGMEIYNIHSDLKAQNPIALGVKFLANYYKDKDWAFALILRRPTPFLERWDALSQKRRVVGIAANDSHQNVKIGREQIDPYPRSFRFVQTHVLATKLEPAEIKRHLAAGHAYVAFELFGAATGFSFTARAGERTLVMGDELTGFQGRATLFARCPKPAAIRLVKDGQTILAVDGDKLEHVVDRPGVYRIECDVEARGERRPWIYSNPIYLRAPK